MCEKKSSIGVLIAIILALTACKKTSKSYPLDLCGLWRTSDNAFLELLRDGSATEVNSFGSFERTWYVSDDNQLNLVSNEGVKTFGNYTLSEDILTWHFKSLDAAMTAVYQKISPEEEKILGELTNDISEKTANLLGTWILKYNNGIPFDGEEAMTLNSNGSAIINYAGVKLPAIWTSCEDQLNIIELTDSDNNCAEMFESTGTFNIKDNTLAWHRMVEGEKITVIYEKK